MVNMAPREQCEEASLSSGYISEQTSLNSVDVIQVNEISSMTNNATFSDIDFLLLLSILTLILLIFSTLFIVLLLSLSHYSTTIFSKAASTSEVLV